MKIFPSHILTLVFAVLLAVLVPGAAVQADTVLVITRADCARLAWNTDRMPT